MLISSSSVLPSVLPLDGFSWNFVFEYFSKICRENSSFTKIGQEQRILYMKTIMHFWSHSLIPLRMRNVSDKTCTEKSTHFVFSNFFFIGNRSFYEIMWRNTTQPGRPQMATRRMRITGWVPKATEPYSEYVILITLSPQQWLHELAPLYAVCTVPVLFCSAVCYNHHSSYSHSTAHVCSHRPCWMNLANSGQYLKSEPSLVDRTSSRACHL